LTTLPVPGMFGIGIAYAMVRWSQPTRTLVNEHPASYLEEIVVRHAYFSGINAGRDPLLGNKGRLFYAGNFLFGLGLFSDPTLHRRQRRISESGFLYANDRLCTWVQPNAPIRLPTRPQFFIFDHILALTSFRNLVPVLGHPADIVNTSEESPVEKHHVTFALHHGDAVGTGY
jgi:hypothetical protein